MKFLAMLLAAGVVVEVVHNDRGIPSTTTTRLVDSQNDVVCFQVEKGVQVSISCVATNTGIDIRSFSKERKAVR